MAPLQAGEECIKAVLVEAPLMFGLNTVISFLDRGTDEEGGRPLLESRYQI
jgi:hypothetical protein